MRTIKFRVWDNELGFMYAGTTLEEMLQDPPKWRDYYVWEQFTGLYDKNGVEIYEGDKLLMKDEIGNSGVVTVGFEYGGFIVFRGLAWRQIGDYDVEKNTIEVIGNIHVEELK